MPLPIMKIINATSEVPGMTKEEVERFLESKLNLAASSRLTNKVSPIYNQSGFTIIKIEKNS